MIERSFVVKLPNDKFAYEKASNFSVWEGGVLVFFGMAGNVAAYAPGEWLKVEEVKPAPVEAKK